MHEFINLETIQQDAQELTDILVKNTSKTNSLSQEAIIQMAGFYPIIYRYLETGERDYATRLSAGRALFSSGQRIYTRDQLQGQLKNVLDFFDKSLEDPQNSDNPEPPQSVSAVDAAAYFFKLHGGSEENIDQYSECFSGYLNHPERSQRWGKLLGAIQNADRHTLPNEIISQAFYFLTSTENDYYSSLVALDYGAMKKRIERNDEKNIPEENNDYSDLYGGFV